MTILDNITHSDVFVAYKREGETPLSCLNRLKDEGFLPYNDKFTYAGRLDPMAEGVMIFLRGEAIKDKDQYLGLDKEYEVEVLLGISTDTGDILGLINSKPKDAVVFDIKNIQTICRSFIGETEVPYPWFSSKTLNGKPLFEWAREFSSEEILMEDTSLGDSIQGDVDDVDDNKEILLRPMTKLSIKDIEILDFNLIHNNELLDKVFQRINKIKGDFRQDKIIHEWDKFSIKKTSRKNKDSDSHSNKNLNKNGDREYPILKIRVKCLSGSYMRTLAELIGAKLKVPALAYSIKRLSIGEYKLETEK